MQIVMYIKKLFILKNEFFLTRLCHSKPTKHIRQESKYPVCIFSGIQPTGSVHLGNYLGAIRQWKKLQDENENVIFSIVDFHSITLPYDHNKIFDNILEMTATLLACGIDNRKSIIFQQSKVPQHTEMCWELACLTTMARLAHLPQYKEKSAALKEVPLGLFIYPVLQAADILAYKATHVPVGEDQVQHLQLAQDLARMFNKRYGETFPTPHSLVIDGDICRLRSLKDPTKKMSKSDPDPKSRIELTDSPDDIVKKIKKAVTDFTSQVYYDPEKRAGVSNLISMHSAVSGKSIKEICDDAKDMNTGQYKLTVAEAMIEHLTPIRTEIERLLNEREYLIHILQQGCDQAKEIAGKTASEVKNKLGLAYSLKRVKEDGKINISN